MHTQFPARRRGLIAAAPLALIGAAALVFAVAHATYSEPALSETEASILEQPAFDEAETVAALKEADVRAAAYPDETPGVRIMPDPGVPPSTFVAP